MNRQTWADREPVEFTDAPPQRAYSWLWALLFVFALGACIAGILAAARAILAPLPEALPPCPAGLPATLKLSLVAVGVFAAVMLAYEHLCLQAWLRDRGRRGE